MALQASTNLPHEPASKLGHLNVIQSKWVKSLIENFENIEFDLSEDITSYWNEFNSLEEPLTHIWATDGSYVSVKSNGSKPNKEVVFVKTALLSVDKFKLDQIDKEFPHPLLLQDIMSESAVFHATVFPLSNVKTSYGNNYDSIRNIINDSLKIDQNGAFFETLKWIAYKKWLNAKNSSPAFSCPHCQSQIVNGLPYDTDEGDCDTCGNIVFLSDMIGFHLDMDEDTAPEAIASAYMLIMELLMIFTAVRLLWTHSDESLVSNTLFIKDGPLTLRSQYSKLVPNIRDFLQFAKNIRRPIHIIGQEKSGIFFDHLEVVSKQVKPLELNDQVHFCVLTHDYVRKDVYRSPDLNNPYGLRTNWGEKVYVKLDPNTCMVLNIPTGDYDPSKNFPTENDLIGLKRILSTLPSLISRKYSGALYPIELANGIASMSSYPSAKILQKFIDT
ncbi:hypothetical protein [Acinetobacter beijerinckii]|uniref:NurA domain-containing protein n=1 Tax=Acinetobacter beijerinckii ANC 3835 TaxID=1217649 RepID=N9E448_9GAMM|nr:hypothetical protein [Acinetobacter beijerinckii]ENW05263.1 hypothetical protein F934_01227 [Acinetobacter beijerinckii ANC 3835]